MSEKNIIHLDWKNSFPFHKKNKREYLGKAINNSIYYFWNKYKHILEVWLWIIEGDKEIFNRIFWWYDFLWWKHCAKEIEEQSNLSKDEVSRALRKWIYLIHSERQKNKAIIILLWIMLSNYARKAIRKTWPFDAETEISDLLECVNRFHINEEMIEKSINFARIRYKNDYNEEVPKLIYSRLNNKINID